jgi:branched-chain amino acid transport system ATP-binding protein
MADAEVLLSARSLTKRFGGLAAVNDVSVDLWRDRIHAVIGPNGAGKSTLTNLLSGDLAPTTGTVALAGKDVTGQSPAAISRGGLGRSYQKTNIFAPFTVMENVRLAAQSRTPPSTPMAESGGRFQRDQPAHRTGHRTCRSYRLHPCGRRHDQPW